MNINDFINKRPYLYHLTDRENIDFIKSKNAIYSTTEIVENSDVEDKINFLRSRREGHSKIVLNETTISIRDQRPISLVALGKCLTDDWHSGDFIKHLNDRVFFWPTLERLIRHYNRYKEEDPVIIRVKTDDLFRENPEPLFCRLNSGATRPNSYLGGIAPERGPNTFLPADHYLRNVGSVAEVTFLRRCIFPQEVEIASAPEGKWSSI
jgi:hypothetical protein